MIKISTSQKRSQDPQSFIYQDEVTIKTWGAITISKVDFFPSSFQVKFDEKIVYFDPVGISSDQKADFIFITHSHPDHLSIMDLQQIIKADTKLICPKSVEKKVNSLKCEIIVIKLKEHKVFNNFSILAVPAYNTKQILLWIKAHPKRKENVGYILTTNKGFRLYHAGDTDNVPELSEIKDIDIALIPVGGDNLTMNIEEASKLANVINPKILIPMHYELKEMEKLQEVRSLLNEVIEIRIMNDCK